MRWRVEKGDVLGCTTSMICLRLNCSLFEDYVTTDKRERYNIMCLIHAYERKPNIVNEYASIAGGRTMSYNSIAEDLK